PPRRSSALGTPNLQVPLGRYRAPSREEPPRPLPTREGGCSDRLRRPLTPVAKTPRAVAMRWVSAERAWLEGLPLRLPLLSGIPVLPADRSPPALSLLTGREAMRLET